MVQRLLESAQDVTKIDGHGYEMAEGMPLEVWGAFQSLQRGKQTQWKSKASAPLHGHGSTQSFLDEVLQFEDAEKASVLVNGWFPEARQPILPGDQRILIQYSQQDLLSCHATGFAQSLKRIIDELEGGDHRHNIETIVGERQDFSITAFQ